MTKMKNYLNINKNLNNTLFETTIQSNDQKINKNRKYNE